MNVERGLLEIINSYQDVVKPLMADLEVRGKDNKIPVNCLNEIRALNDHIARCYRDGMDDKAIAVELVKAEGHLKRLIFDCFKQLNVFLYDKIESKEKKYYSSLWLGWNQGKFWNDYLNAKINARKASIEAKKKETEDADWAMKKYEEAYCCYRKVEDLLNEKENKLWLSFFYRYVSKVIRGWNWLITTIILSLVASVIVYYIDKF